MLNGVIKKYKNKVLYCFILIPLVHSCCMHHDGLPFTYLLLDDAQGHTQRPPVKAVHKLLQRQM